MKREDLESKVRISVGPASPGGRTEMTATLEIKATACLDPYVLRGLVEKKLRECVVWGVLGDLEAENARLRAAVCKWSGRARQCCPYEAMKFQEELKEDLR